MYKITDIPIGREHAISRADLAKLWNCNDRAARRRIAILRCQPVEDGMFIVSHSQGGVKGYYRTDKPDEIRHFIHEGRKRMRNIAAPIDNARKLLLDIEGRAAG